MLQLSEDQIKAFQQKILTWYSEHQRDLPWRKSQNPYNILISEVMSQQTQISRVIPKYETWMNHLPAVQDLANASTREVLTLWSGLGYNRRAIYLQKAAQKVLNEYNGEFPKDEKTLRTLPGIGEYTARAILCFAFGQQIAVIDTNVRKVILTQFEIPNVQYAMSNQELQEIADRLLPQGRAYEWNQALMDYSAGMLKKEKIPIPKQSKFKDSDRYYRGQIIKVLILQNTVTHSELYDHLNKQEKIINKERLGEIIERLLKDKLIAKNNGIITLP